MAALTDFLAARPPRPNPSEYLSLGWCFELGRSFMRPRRPGVARALALHDALRCDPLAGPAARAAQAEAAWERAIAEGLVPADWAADPARRFAVETTSEGNWVFGAVRLAPAPRTAGDVVALAADVGGVLAAEGAAAEWLERRAQFVGPRDGRADEDGVVWRVVPADSALPRNPAFLIEANRVVDVAARGAGLGALADQPVEAFLEGAGGAFPSSVAALRRFRSSRDYGSAPGGIQEVPASLFLFVTSLLEKAACWREVATRGARLPRPWEWPALPAGARADQVLDPFEPLLRIVGLGYLPEMPYRGRAVLTAPSAIRYPHVEERPGPAADPPPEGGP